MTLSLIGRLSRRGDAPLGERCPLERAVQLLGNRTTLLLLREVFYGASRFDELTRRVGVSETVASQRLRELVDAGVLAREPYREPGQRTRQAYVLTTAGHDLLPAVLALLQWGAAHTPGSAPPVVHEGCGRPVGVELRCEAGHRVDEDEVTVG